MQGDGQWVDVTEETVKNLFEVQWPHRSNWRIIPWLPNSQNSRAKYLMARCQPIGFKSFSSLNHGNKLNKKESPALPGCSWCPSSRCGLSSRLSSTSEDWSSQGSVRRTTFQRCPTSPRFYRQFPTILGIPNIDGFHPFMCWTIDASWSDMISSLRWVINFSKLMYLPHFFPTWWSQVGWTNRLLARETATTRAARVGL